MNHVNKQNSPGKIGIITFHWATNYGAVLQAYAMQQFLQKNGLDVSIVSYLPARVRLKDFLSNLLHGKWAMFAKERRLRLFRDRYLRLSRPVCRSSAALRRRCGSAFDTVICGSDQIWNQSFIRGAEKSCTLSYFADFAGESTSRIAYAPSFGTTRLDPAIQALIAPELKKFTKLSVRERSGRQILEDMGLSAEVVLDPTLLLEACDYDTLLGEEQAGEKAGYFSYLLHSNQTAAKELDMHLRQRFSGQKGGPDVQTMSLTQWLSSIRHARLVLTNSFHGMVFSILFHTDFLVVMVEGADMNDRITTLLADLGLTDRIVAGCDPALADALAARSIDWEKVEQRRRARKKESVSFLASALGVNLHED